MFRPTNIKIMMLGFILCCVNGFVAASESFIANSWLQLDVSKYNKIIKKAHYDKYEWVRKPELYVHYLLGLTETKEVLYSIEANRIEMPTEFKVKLKRTGLLDDSVSGDIHILVLQKPNKGYWSVVSAKRASSCWRAKLKSFQSKPCP